MLSFYLVSHCIPLRLQLDLILRNHHHPILSPTQNHDPHHHTQAHCIHHHHILIKCLFQDCSQHDV
jgi:hypothetical protein